MGTGCTEPLKPEELDQIIKSVKERIAAKAQEKGKGNPWYPRKEDDGSPAPPMSATVVDEQGKSKDALIKLNDQNDDFLIARAITEAGKEDALEREVADFNSEPGRRGDHEHFWRTSEGTYEGTSRGHFDWPGDEEEEDQ